MESTYDVFGVGDLPTFWPSFLSWRKEKVRTAPEVSGDQAAKTGKRRIPVSIDRLQAAIAELDEMVD